MAKASKSTVPPPPSRRDAIVAAYMTLLADREPAEIGLAEIAGTAGVTLAELRAEFASAFDILAAFLKGVDEAVLAGIDPALADQPVRERLFDILMRRLDAFGPHKAAIRTLARAAGRDPGLAMALNRLSVGSHRWMLAAAGVKTFGPGGAVRAQGLALAFGSVLRTWLDDDDPALARTMRVLDEALGRAGRAARVLKGLEQAAAPFQALACAPFLLCRRRTWSRDRWRDRGPREEGWRGDDLRDPHVTPV